MGFDDGAGRPHGKAHIYKSVFNDMSYAIVLLAGALSAVRRERIGMGMAGGRPEKGLVKNQQRRAFWVMRNQGLVLAVLSATPIFAVQLGDTREAVIAELSNPQSQMAAGTREFLNYPDGRVEISDGRVIEFRGVLAKPAAPAPLDQGPGAPPVQQPVPIIQSAPVATVAPPAQRASRQRTAHWYTDIAPAQAAAQKEKKLILALFTGTDWCGPCQQFKTEVELDQQFADIFSGSFVFFKNDWLRNTPQPKVVQEEVGRVKRKYRISAYPTLKVLNDEGEVLDTVEWTKVQGGTFKEIMIEAIDNSRKATKGGKKAASGWWPF